MSHDDAARNGTTDEPLRGDVRGVGKNVLIDFIPHARERLADRGITVAQVLAVLRVPDVTGLEADEGRRRYRRYQDATRAIDVVFEVFDDAVLVVTAFWSS